ncbi:pancreatic triacylglycerol lipase-like [Diprion similis]|uniref:pancreatic triacylglycerol lipase-like n=1 Tax=Diprion similis TaxID=362088 RepID=UPI001EF85E51|nr:pancreatic triacylglycerol lipase-like [Diprion similis]
MQSSWLLYFCLPLVAAVTNCSYTPCEDCTIRATPDELANISLRFYTGTNLDNYEEELVGNAVNLLNYFDNSKPTAFYVSGWTESPESSSVRAVVSEYLKRGDHNVLLADYRYIAAKPYPFAAMSVPGVGYTVAQAFNELVKNGLNSSLLHVVGHSLGAQISGNFGKCTDFIVPRITGLDPAGPAFYYVIENLMSGDADFVEIIYTDAGIYGTANNSGDASFYPNGGTRLQPGCNLSLPLSDDDFCSHHRSWQFYAESLQTEDAFVGQACNSYSNWTSGLCDSNTTAVMGYGTSTTAKGKFYFQTNSVSPYGRKTEGLTYDASI